MNNIVLIAIFLFSLACSSPVHNDSVLQSKTEPSAFDKDDSIPASAQKLIHCYEAVVGYSNGHLLFDDGSKLLFDDQKNKSEYELLDSPDLEDMFHYSYKHWTNSAIPINYDPGRIRVDSFFMKVYGRTQAEVQSKLTTVKWCPQLVNQAIQVTTVNGVNFKIDSISKELDAMPEFREYLKNIGGTFNWRKISGTDRMSMHSFGMTLDVNTKYSNYWQWDCKCKNEDELLIYKNKIPLEIVRVFEKYGFIWGGNWYHYDTMHFEYRPELF